MFFYLKIKLDTFSPIQLLEIIEKRKENYDEPQRLYYQKGAQYLHRQSLAKGELIILGDPVFPKSKLDWECLIQTDNRPDQDALFLNVRGHYYWFYITSGAFYCGSSLSAIYPVYYHESNGELVLSSSSITLSNTIGGVSQNKRNLLERLLFNYPFFNSTWWNEISLLEAHRYLDVAKGQMTVGGTFEVSNYFGYVEDRSKKSLQELVPIFQEETSLFFPDAPFGISWTGGFDGRTIVAAARKANREFSTYSFGRPSSSDIYFPIRQAPKLNIPYTPIYLNESYLENDSLEAAYQFMTYSEYNGNFGRPHYAYAAAKLSKKVNFVLTGNFGSELFRAFHEPGVILSESLYDFFITKDDSWKDRLRSTTLGWDPEYFGDTVEELIADLEKYLTNRKDWDPNHRFYDFVFNEIFRKYFGPELLMQSHFFNNRTPYLSLPWMSALNKTIWSGVHARLFEQLKSKRMKGQMFYSSFLKYADKEMYPMKTNKSYSAADVLESWRLPLLVGKVFIHKYVKPREENENASEDFFMQHFEQIAQKIDLSEMPAFIQARMKNSFSEIPKGESIMQWVKFYTIVEGWNASKRQVTVTQ